MPYKDPARQAQYRKDRWPKEYAARKDRYRARSEAQKVKNKKSFDEYKSSLQCERCPENHPACLEFHHPSPSEKEINVGDAHRLGWSIARIMKEIEKCQVLCSNCHRKLHYEEKNVSVD